MQLGRVCMPLLLSGESAWAHRGAATLGVEVPEVPGPHLQVAQLALPVLHTQSVHERLISLFRRLALLFFQQGAQAVLL